MIHACKPTNIGRPNVNIIVNLNVVRFGFIRFIFSMKKKQVKNAIKAKHPVIALRIDLFRLLPDVILAEIDGCVIIR